MDTYQLNFAGLLGLCAVLFVAQRKPASLAKTSTNNTSSKPVQQEKIGAAKDVVNSAEASQWPFLTVFALVMGSDWLQARRTHPPSLPRFHSPVQ